MRFLLIIMMFMLTSPALAQQSGTTCGKINLNSERLQCYDKLFRNPKKAEGFVSKYAGKGKWQTQTKISKFKDTRDVYLYNPTNNKIRDDYRGFRDTYMVIRCRENTTAVLFTFDNHMTDHSHYGTVEYRIDDERSRRIDTSVSTDKDTLGLWKGSRSIPFIRKLLNRDKLIIRATPYGENAQTMEFTISGLENVIEPLAEECNWKP